jgi:DNA-binding NtrC family response regulator
MTDTLSVIVSKGRKTHSAAALYIGIAADAPRTPGTRVSLRGIDRVELGRGARRTIARKQAGGADIVSLELGDARMSSQHARVTRVGGAWVLEDLGSKNGTLVGTAPITRHELEDGDVFLVGHTAVVFRTAGGEAGDLDGAAPVAPGLATLSPALADAFQQLASAARTTVPIEITGETGTGKELAARAVHALSGRPGAFGAVNCGALAGTLLEGELFGHKKGAYTGADSDRAGLVRATDRGTFFLDEIAELPASSQAALLRVLQEGEVVPVGDDRAVKVDLRVVTATHKSLDREVDAGRFRADLRARLLGVAIAIPPLRERREDLATLVATLLDRVAPDRAVMFSLDSIAALYAHHWPLNIRELERALAAALAVAGDRIELQHLPPALRSESAAKPAPPEEDSETRTQLAAALDRHAGNIAAVARELGKDPTQIRRWMKRFGLTR